MKQNNVFNKINKVKYFREGENENERRKNLTRGILEGLV